MISRAETDHDAMDQDDSREEYMYRKNMMYAYADTSISSQLKTLGGVTAVMVSMCAASFMTYTPPVPKVHRTERTVPVVAYQPIIGRSIETTLMKDATIAFTFKDHNVVMQGHSIEREYAYNLDHIIDTLNPSQNYGMPPDLRVKNGSVLLVPDFDGDLKLNGVRCERKGSITFSGAYDETARAVVDQHWTIQQ